MKKFVSLFMVMAMCVCMMAGCGSASAPAAEATPAAESTTDGSAAFKFGGVGPLTGAAAIYGQAVKTASRSPWTRSTPRAASTATLWS